jgi:hypothetical protein
MTSNDNVTMNDKPKILWKEEFLVYFKVLACGRRKPRHGSTTIAVLVQTRCLRNPQERELTTDDEARPSW